ncbi:hypothetical protein PIB30_045362 [Stylosanthes scabra]|uniref:Uncharacterized protein n=1 Tax=Stylosanthes scabra TaxID=79078 RepID=A0ABU6SGA1_9FABA|nr:hypothetical protein [Stylosanthes scabra]
MPDDEERGPKLRASKKLPALVSYETHGAIKGCCHNECAICLEDFEEGQHCQVFPSNLLASDRSLNEAQIRGGLVLNLSG